jgi:hypothetical protein
MSDELNTSFTHYPSLITLFMEPEIDRRCPDCGAAVRPQAAFCPQCGRTTKAAPDAAGITALVTEDAQTPNAGRPEKDGENAARPITVASPMSGTSETPVAQPPPPAAPAPPAPTSKPEPISIPAQVTREQIVSGKPLGPPLEPAARKRSQRVAAAARDVVGERLAPRVEKIRQASNVVWDEAQDDPNLRFILIAVFLFIVALVIILLGTYMR